MTDGPWHVIHARDIQKALDAVAAGGTPEDVYDELVQAATEREDYREREGFHEAERLSDPFETNDPRQLLHVIEIQRNALEFLMRENLEKAGEDVAEAPQRVDMLLSQPLG